MHRNPPQTKLQPKHGAEEVSIAYPHTWFLASGSVYPLFMYLELYCHCFSSPPSPFHLFLSLSNIQLVFSSVFAKVLYSETQLSLCPGPSALSYAHKTHNTQLWHFSRAAFTRTEEKERCYFSIELSPLLLTYEWVCHTFILSQPPGWFFCPPYFSKLQSGSFRLNKACKFTAYSSLEFFHLISQFMFLLCINCTGKQT